MSEKSPREFGLKAEADSWRMFFGLLSGFIFSLVRAPILCAAMPQAQAEGIIEANSHRYDKFATFDADGLRRAVAQGRRQGYAFLDGAVTAGTAAVGVAFPKDNPVAALSVAAISGRLDPERRAGIAQLIRREVRQLTAAIEANAELNSKPPAAQPGRVKP